MKPTDLAEFSAVLDGVCALLSRGAYQPNAASLAMFFRALQAHPLEVVRQGFDAHCRDPQRGRFVPVPADILAQIEGAAADDGRPDADEAWAMALRAADEAGTVVWTAETAEAWGICKPVLDGGDEVGARMAFKAAYGRLLTAARTRREPAQWSASIGHDPQMRDEALRLGVESGRLPDAYLPAPRGPVAGLLELAQQRGCPTTVRDRLLEIRQQILRRVDEPSEDAANKVHTASLKAAAAQAVAQAMGGRA